MSDQYNAFISYAWRDNEPMDKSGEGWVSTFVNRLRPLLDRELPRNISRHGIWLDYEQMRGSDNISHKIRAKLEGSCLLVPIISKSYLDSPWCRQEREIFIQRHGADSGRVFPVWMEPVENLPGELDDLLKYSFWYEDDKKRPRTRWFPDMDPTDREYGNIQQDMARDMAACLKDIGAAEAAPVSADNYEPAPHPAGGLNGKHTVLVDGGEEDRDLINQVAACLWHKHHIGAIVPVSALPDPGRLKSSQLTRDLRDKMKLCTAVLMVYRNGPLLQIHGHINEYLKSMSKRPKNCPPATLDICHPAHGDPPKGIFLPGIKVHPCDADCAADCARHFAEGVS